MPRSLHCPPAWTTHLWPTLPLQTPHFRYLSTFPYLPQERLELRASSLRPCDPGDHLRLNYLGSIFKMQTPQPKETNYPTVLRTCLVLALEVLGPGEPLRSV